MGYLLQGRLTVAAIGSTHQVANDITKAFLQLINPFGLVMNTQLSEYHWIRSWLCHIATNDDLMWIGP